MARFPFRAACARSLLRTAWKLGKSRILLWYHRESQIIVTASFCSGLLLSAGNAGGESRRRGATAEVVTLFCDLL